MVKWVYLFEEGDDTQRALLGGKGAGLAEMARAGLLVPPGFIVATEACNAYYTNGKNFPAGMWEQVIEGLRAVEQKTDKKFGDPENPLLVSVRSSAPFSMPGMMDTVLSLGLNEQTVQGLATQTGDMRFALDAYRRFAMLFGEIVMGVAHEKFERMMERYKAPTEGGRDTDLSPEQLREIIAAEKQIIFAEHHGTTILEDPYEQLRVTIAAAFNSWMGRRAVDYRCVNRIPDGLGTAVNVQAMVFGNMGQTSGTGVAFTRNPSTGEKALYGEYLLNAQGEDVLAGIRTPQPISQMQEELPEVHEQLRQVAGRFEKHYRDMGDIEFTFERGKLWALQTRIGKRTGYAGLRIVLDLLDEGLITEKQSVLRIQPEWLEQCFAPKLPKDLDRAPIAVGLPASPGIASGTVVIRQETAERLIDAGERVILFREEASPDDFHIMVKAEGVVTSRGGMTSHNAVVCRGLFKPCVAGARDIHIDYEYDHASFSTSTGILLEGEVVTIDGYSGSIYSGKIEFVNDDNNDPLIQRITSLVWSVDTNEYIEDGLGVIWLLRDIIKDKSALQFSLFNPLINKFNSSDKQYEAKPRKYISFIQPPNDIVSDILPRMSWSNSDDTKIVAWGILYTLQRQLQNAVGIGNHPLTIRPLNDPARSFINLDKQSLLPLTEVQKPIRERAFLYQLIGLEFFGINRFLRHALPWGSIQWWGAVRVDDDLNGAWRLDEINPEGESLIQGSSDLAGFLIALDNQCLSIEATRGWYNELRKRELGWSWYREHNISWREVIEYLHQIRDSQANDQNMLSTLRDLGLLSEDLKLTTTGIAIIKEETAYDRRRITFCGRRLHDG